MHADAPAPEYDPGAHGVIADAPVAGTYLCRSRVFVAPPDLARFGGWLSPCLILSARRSPEVMTENLSRHRSSSRATRRRRRRRHGRARVGDRARARGELVRRVVAYHRRRGRFFLSFFPSSRLSRRCRRRTPVGAERAGLAGRGRGAREAARGARGLLGRALAVDERARVAEAARGLAEGRGVEAGGAGVAGRRPRAARGPRGARRRL